MKWCPINDCGASISNDRLMCRRHWSLVPSGLQRTIWRLWHRGTPRPGHLEACMSAIEQVNETSKAREAVGGSIPPQ